MYNKEVEICVRLLFIVWCGLEVARNAVTIVKMLDKVSTFFVPKVTSSSGKKNFITPCVKRFKNVLPVKRLYTPQGGCKEVFKNKEIGLEKRRKYNIID